MESSQAQESESPLIAVPLSQACTDPHLADMLRAMSETFSTHLASLSGQMATLSERVDSVEQGPRPSSQTSMMPTTTPPLIWCDRSFNEPVPNKPVIWPDKKNTEAEGDDQRCQLIEISEPTETLFKEAFAKPVPNATRHC